MNKKTKVLLWIIVVFVFIWILTPVFLGIKTHNATDGKIKLCFFLTHTCAKVFKFQWKIFDKPYIELNARSTIKLPWKSLVFGTTQLLAFEGPGSIVLPSGNSKINFSGEIQGNFKTGEVNIKSGSVWLEKFGNIFVSGKLVKWGKETCEIQGKVKDFSVEELRTVFGIESLPFAGVINGNLSVIINKDIVKLLKFDVSFSNLYFQKQSKPLSGNAKGSYDILQKKCFVESGNNTTHSGGKILLKGFVSPEEFSLKIESEGVNLDEIISQLPEKWQEKIKVKNNSGISINIEGFRDKKEHLPFISGFLSLPGEICFNNFSCCSFALSGSQDNKEINIEAEKIGFGNINCREIKGKIISYNDKYKGNITFNLYDGKGNISFVSSEAKDPLKFYAKADVKRINLEKLIHNLNPDVLVTGIVNLICFMEFGKNNVSLMARFDNVPGRPFSQKLNIGAVEALAKLGSSSFSGSIGRQFGSENFYYRRIGGVINYQDGLLTIEGTVKKAGNYDYLVTSEIFGSGINVLVDKKNNSIHIEDLKQRINNAMKQNKPEMKFS